VSARGEKHCSQAGLFGMTGEQITLVERKPRGRGAEFIRQRKARNGLEETTRCALLQNDVPITVNDIRLGCMLSKRQLTH